MKYNDFLNSIDLSSRKKRREAVKLAARLVGSIHLAESQYMLRIPLNLQGSSVYDAADETLDCLEEAINSLESAYE